MENIIEIKNLKKSFGEIKAVNDLTFSVKQGELFAFLGENGAGKSTTISIFCGQLQKDGGEIVIDGENLEDNLFSIKQKLGVVFQNSVLDKHLTVYENLEHRASLYGIFDEAFKARLKELCELLDLDELLNRPIGKLSGGQRRRIDIARALIHSPKILVLDEPTTGLDPQTRKTVWAVLDNLRKDKGLTVFLTTHYMEEAAEADYIVILDKGKICAEGTPLALKNAYTNDYINLYGVEEDRVTALNLEYKAIRDGYSIAVENTAAARDLILRCPELFVDYEIIKGKMDDVFLAVTGKTFKGEER
jgi:multidrug/hemolysin transport system ATP-binding protein